MRLAKFCLLLTLFPLAAQTQQPHPSTLQRLWTLDATYTDAVHGVSFRYSSAWKPGIQWGYHPPALSYDTDHPPIAGFGFSAGGFPDPDRREPYAHSNLEGFGIVYLAEPQPGADACEHRAASLVYDGRPSKLADTEIISGIKYSMHDYASAGMSQSTTGPLYATWRDGICYLFELAISVSDGAADNDPKAWPAVDTDAILQRLDRVMQTVRFTPPQSKPVNPPPLKTYRDAKTGVTSVHFTAP